MLRYRAEAKGEWLWGRRPGRFMAGTAGGYIIFLETSLHVAGESVTRHFYAFFMRYIEKRIHFGEEKFLVCAGLDALVFFRVVVYGVPACGGMQPCFSSGQELCMSSRIWEGQ